MRKNWAEIELGKLSDFVIGGDWGKAPEINDPEFEFAYCIRGSEFKSWKTDKGKTASLRKLKKNSIEKRKLKIGDILIEISGGGPEQPVGRTVLIDENVLYQLKDHPVVCTNFFRLFRPSSLIYGKWLIIFLNFFYKAGKTRKYQGGSNNLRNLKYKQFATIEIPLAPLPEQRAIVTKIEQLFSELDNGMANLKAAREKLDLYRQAVLKKAFEGNYEIEQLGNIAQVKRGKSKHRPRNDKSLFGGKYPFIQTGEIKAACGGIIKSYTNTYSEKGLAQSKLWPKGTLCLTIAANIGETAFLDFDACFPDSVVGIIPNKELLIPKYLNFYVQKVKEEISDNAPATAQKNINVRFLESLEIPLPSLEEQNQIVQAIETRLSVCDKLSEIIEAEIARSQSLRQSILKKAFEGWLLSEAEIRECKKAPDWEPAKKLLKQL